MSQQITLASSSREQLLAFSQWSQHSSRKTTAYHLFQALLPKKRPKNDHSFSKNALVLSRKHLQAQISFIGQSDPKKASLLSTKLSNCDFKRHELQKLQSLGLDITGIPPNPGLPGGQSMSLLSYFTTFAILIFSTLWFREKFFKRTTALNPSFAMAYLKLGAALPRGGSTTLEDDSRWTQVELFKRAIAIDPSFATAYSNLGTVLPEGGLTTLEDGSRWTQVELFKRAIALDPSFATAYSNLGTVLPEGGSTTLEDGSLWTKERLIERSEELL